MDTAGDTSESNVIELDFPKACCILVAGRNIETVVNNQAAMDKLVREKGASAVFYAPLRHFARPR